MINNLTYLGRCGADPEIRYAPNGNQITTVRLANSRVYYNSNKDKVEDTTWLKCTAFGKNAETLGKYVKKGDLLGICGYLKQNEWTDKEGNKRSEIVCIIEQIHLMPKGMNQSQGASQPQQQPPKTSTQTRNNFEADPFAESEGFNESNDTIPF